MDSFGNAAAAEGSVNSIGLVLTLAMGMLLLVVPRRYALVPVVILMCFMSMGQAIVVMGLHFTMIRILAVLGWTRLFIRGEICFIKFNPIDNALILWTVSCFVLYNLLWQTAGAFIYRLGQSYDAIGFYFVFRYLIRDLDDVRRVLKITAVVTMPLAAAMLMEKLTGRNMFAALGDVDAMTVVRDGVLRCQGPFAHPILAGTFGATLLPLFVSLWQQGRGTRLFSVFGVISSIVITFTSGSSGPILASLAAIGGLTMWRFRNYMKAVRWGLALTLITLQLSMKAPIWFLIARADVFSSSTGWHRAFLIDRAIANFDKWWLVGTKSTEAWGFWLHDVTNQYIWQGVQGGLLTMVLFITIIVFCFRGVGRAVRMLESESARSARFVWAMGAALFSHVVIFFSVTYYDQNVVNWYLLLAMISTATGRFASCRKPAQVSARKPTPGSKVELTLPSNRQHLELP